MTKILVAGPHGAGKTVLVRQVMSLYDRQTRVSGGVGGLPLAYTMSRRTSVPRGEGHCDVTWSSELEILGNYDLDTRARHGLTQFDRYRADFLQALRHACSVRWSVLCEGGTVTPRRVHTPEGEEFSRDCQIVYLAPESSRTDSTASRGRDLGDESHERHLAGVIRMIEAMSSLGARVTHAASRDVALETVCRLIHLSLDPSRAKTPAPDYR